MSVPDACILRGPFSRSLLILEAFFVIIFIHEAPSGILRCAFRSRRYQRIQRPLRLTTAFHNPLKNLNHLSAIPAPVTLSRWQFQTRCREHPAHQNTTGEPRLESATPLDPTVGPCLGSYGGPRGGGGSYERGIPVVASLRIPCPCNHSPCLPPSGGTTQSREGMRTSAS